MKVAKELNVGKNILCGGGINYSGGGGGGEGEGGVCCGSQCCHKS